MSNWIYINCKPMCAKLRNSIMNIKLGIVPLASVSLLIAASPMMPTSMSTDNGGTKLAIDAYSDGAGILMINQAADTKFDNSSMNKLVFKYGDAAKSSNTTIKNQVNVLSPGATALEKAAATTSLEIAKIVINPPVNGVSCDDGSPSTIGDSWSGGICAGTYATSCKAIKTANPTAADGTYTIDPDGTGGASPYSVVCDMTTDGGGWTYLATEMKTLGLGTNTGQNGLTASSVYASAVNGSSVHFGAAVVYKVPAYTELYYKQTAGLLGYLCAGNYWDARVSGGGDNLSLTPYDTHYPGFIALNSTFSTSVTSNNVFIKLTAPSTSTMVQVGMWGYNGCSRVAHTTIIKVR